MESQTPGTSFLDASASGLSDSHPDLLNEDEWKARPETLHYGKDHRQFLISLMGMQLTGLVLEKLMEKHSLMGILKATGSNLSKINSDISGK